MELTCRAAVAATGVARATNALPAGRGDAVAGGNGVEAGS